MKEITTKQKVINAASLLFYQNGFHGTSVRDIADKANVNVSLISYYFKSKQGLLEYAVTSYYESYLELMEETIEQHKNEQDLICCKALINKMLEFRMEYYQLTAFINRELSLDSTFVREMAVTYLAKENHYLSTIFEKILPEGYTNHKLYLLIQLKGMMMSPFILKSEWDQNIFDKQGRDMFIMQYSKVIDMWLDYVH